VADHSGYAGGREDRAAQDADILKALCEGLPKESSLMLDMIRHLSFHETAKYFELHKFLRRLFIKDEFIFDGVFT
jgi:hypothetical protein